MASKTNCLDFDYL